MAAALLDKLMGLVGFEVVPDAENENAQVDLDARTDERYEEEPMTKRDKKRDQREQSKVVEMPRMANAMGRQKMVIYQPADFADATEIVANLRGNLPLIINLDGIETPAAQRMLDFVSGAACALDGTIKKVTRSIFVVVPRSVDLTTNMEDD